jgi:hypothetical protein
MSIKSRKMKKSAIYALLCGIGGSLLFIAITASVFQIDLNNVIWGGVFGGTAAGSYPIFKKMEREGKL